MLSLRRSISLIKLYEKKINLLRIGNKSCCVSVNEFSTSLGLCKENSEFLKVKQEFWEGEKKKFEDTFGDLGSFERKFNRIKDDPDDILQYERDKAAQNKTTQEYYKEIHDLLAKHEYSKALQVLEVDMVNDRIRTNPYIYNMFINYNAEIGDLKEAYRIYLNFKKRQGVITPAICTSILNACATFSDSMLALEKIEAIREQLENKKFKLNISNYNVLIKAYGRHGDLKSALKVFDEVMEKRDKIHPRTFSFLLQSCISDKNSGLRHAMILWRRMLQLQVIPNTYVFNLLLRCIHECSFGDIRLLEDFCKQIAKESQKFFKRRMIIKKVNGKTRKLIFKIPLSEASFLSLLNVDTQKCAEEKVNNVKNDELIQLKGPVEHLDDNNPSSEVSTHYLNSDFTSMSDEKKEENSFQEENVSFVKSPAERLHDNNPTPEVSTHCLNRDLTSMSDEKKEENIFQEENVSFVKSPVERLHDNNPTPEVSTHCLNSDFISESDEKKEGNSFQEENVSDVKTSQIPNLIEPKPFLGNINPMDLGNPQNRFKLLGGVKGFLRVMSLFKVQPDVKTFTQLLNLIPQTIEAENEVIELSQAHNVKLDTGFFNILLKNRNMRNETVQVQETLKLMQERELVPDIITFGVLALGCKTAEEAIELIKSLHRFGYRVNQEIMGPLIQRAVYNQDLGFLKILLEVVKKDELNLRPKTLERISKLIKVKRNSLERIDGESQEIKAISE